MSKYGGENTAKVVLEIPKRYLGIAQQMQQDLSTLVEKNTAYGDSWKRRGGAGAYLTLVRPWDRLEEMVRRHGWDVFAAGASPARDPDTDILDSIRDVRNYLHLIEQEILAVRVENERVVTERAASIMDVMMRIAGPRAVLPVEEGPQQEAQPRLFDLTGPDGLPRDEEEPDLYDFERHPADSL